LRVLKLFALASLAILGFDTLASFASLATGFSYSYAAYGSVILYLVFTFVAGRNFGFLLAISLGAVMGIVDSTLGWAISWAIGPGRPPGSSMTESTLIEITIALVVAMAVFWGVVGGGAGALVARTRRTSNPSRVA